MTPLIRPIDPAWKTLSPDEKLEIRVSAWREAQGITFATPEAKEAYRERVTNIVDAVQLKKMPARVPMIASAEAGGFWQSYCGYTFNDLMHDVDKAIDVTTRCTIEFDLDAIAAIGGYQGRVNEILGDKVNLWPGHGLPEDADGMQYLEGEYMKADEYDTFFEDPSDFHLRTYLPRIWRAAEAFAKLTPLSRLNVSNFGQPEIQAAFEKLGAAGREAVSWQQKKRAATRRLTELGYPTLLSRGEDGGGGGVPFARFGDRLRGTKGIMTDMLRQPDKLLEALERLAAAQIKRAKTAGSLGDSPIVDFHLHKGSDRVMSDKHFRIFYWEPLRKIILALINEGFLVGLRFEGGFNSRLGPISDLPKGKTIWWLSHETNTARAKEVARDVACIGGNIPAALLHAGSTDEIVSYCRSMIEVAGRGGGYIFTTPMEGISSITKVENVWAMFKTVRKYGVYS